MNHAKAGVYLPLRACGLRLVDTNADRRRAVSESTGLIDRVVRPFVRELGDEGPFDESLADWWKAPKSDDAVSRCGGIRVRRSVCGGGQAPGMFAPAYAAACLARPEISAGSTFESRLDDGYYANDGPNAAAPPRMNRAFALRAREPNVAAPHVSVRTRAVARQM